MKKAAGYNKDNQTLNIFINNINAVSTSTTTMKRSPENSLSLRKQQSVSARVILVNALSFLYGEPEAHWVFNKNSPLPKLTNHPDIHISLSHSGTFVGCAISSCPCGFDLQVHVEKDLLGIAETFFCQPEYKMLSRLTPAKQREQFFRLWTLKEAWSKIPGENFLDTLGNVSFLPGESIKDGYSIWYINLQENLSSAMTVHGHLDHLMLWQYNEGRFVEWPIEQVLIERLI